MDPISLTLGIVGLGMSIFGGAKQAIDTHRDTAKITQDQQQIAQISKDEATQEQGINDAKQRQMELEGRRTQLENIRNMQRARAMATNAAVNQGANLGSGLQGGLAQISDQSNFNMLGVNQGLQIGREIAGFNQNITQDKYRMADAQAQVQADQASMQANSSTNQGIMSLGGSLLKAGPIVGQISQGFGFGFGGNYNGKPGARNTGGLY